MAKLGIFVALISCLLVIGLAVTSGLVGCTVFKKFTKKLIMKRAKGL